MTEEENPLVSEYILKKLILLYGFSLEIKHLAKTNYSENFYLINAEWLNKFKDFYNYNKITGFLKQYYAFLEIYNEYENKIDTIINAIKKINMHQKEKEFPKELKQIPFCVMQENGGNSIYYHNNFYIVNSDLNESLSKDIESKNYSFINMNTIKIFFGKDYFLFQENNIEICDINYDGMFIPKFIIKLGAKKKEEEINNIIKNGGKTQIFKEKKIDKNKLSNNYKDGDGGIILNIEIIKKEREEKEKEEKEKQKQEKQEQNQRRNIQHSGEIGNLNDINENNSNQKVNNDNFHPLTYNIKNIQQTDNSEDELSKTKQIIKRANIFKSGNNAPNEIKKNENNIYP